MTGVKGIQSVNDSFSKAGSLEKENNCNRLADFSVYTILTLQKSPSSLKLLPLFSLQNTDNPYLNEPLKEVPMALFTKSTKRGTTEKFDKKKRFNWEEENRHLIALIQSGDLEQALVAGQQMVDHVDQVYRKDSKEKATTYNNMGMVFMLSRDYELADQCFREALMMRIRLFGESNNEVAVVLLNMAELYSRQAREIMAANRVIAGS